MTNEFPAGASKNTYAECVFIEKDDGAGADYHFGISRYERDFSDTYKETDLVLYQKYTYEDVCRLLNWETNEVPLNIGGYKYDKKQRPFL